MPTKEKKIIESLFKELKEVNKNLKKLFLSIPEESIGDYENDEEIKEALRRAAVRPAR